MCLGLLAQHKNGLRGLLSVWRDGFFDFLLLESTFSRLVSRSMINPELKFNYVYLQMQYLMDLGTTGSNLNLNSTDCCQLGRDRLLFKKNFTNPTHTRLHSLHFRHHVHAVWKPTLFFQICDMVMNRGTSCCFKRPTGVKSNELLRHPVITMV